MAGHFNSKNHLLKVKKDHMTHCLTPSTYNYLNGP